MPILIVNRLAFRNAFNSLLVQIRVWISSVVKSWCLILSRHSSLLRLQLSQRQLINWCILYWCTSSFLVGCILRHLLVWLLLHNVHIVWWGSSSCHFITCLIRITYKFVYLVVSGCDTICINSVVDIGNELWLRSSCWLSCSSCILWLSLRTGMVSSSIGLRVSISILWHLLIPIAIIILRRWYVSLYLVCV